MSAFALKNAYISLYAPLFEVLAFLYSSHLTIFRQRFFRKGGFGNE